jgi:CheY-like chemotaxis protein
MRILVLEDDENRIHKFRENFIGCQLDITKDPNQANKWLEENEYDAIFLDHDLEDAHYLEDCKSSETTGLCVADFLGKNLHLSKKAQVFIHSLNWSGRERMRQACIKRNPQVIPFTHLFGRLIIT